MKDFFQSCNFQPSTSESESEIFKTKIADFWGSRAPHGNKVSEGPINLDTIGFQVIIKSHAQKNVTPLTYLDNL